MATVTGTAPDPDVERQTTSESECDDGGCCCTSSPNLQRIKLLRSATLATEKPGARLENPVPRTVTVVPPCAAPSLGDTAMR